MSVIASMQLASPLAWGLFAERIDVRFVAMLRFVVQGVGLGLAISTGNFLCLYAGFFLYGIGLGGNMVLPDILWANYFGRRSLGKVRGMGLLISQVLAAVGPPFFGFLFDVTGGYGLSFAIFGVALMTSAGVLECWSNGVLIEIRNPLFQYSITPLLQLSSCCDLPVSDSKKPIYTERIPL